MINAPAHGTVAVLRLSSAGDVLLTSGPLMALRRAWPGCRIVFVTQPAFAPLVQGQAHIDAVCALPRRASLRAARAALRGLGAAAVLDLHGKARSRLLRLLMPGCRWVVWHRRRSLAQRLAVAVGGARVQEHDLLCRRYHAAVEQLVGHALPAEPLHFAVPGAAQARADALLPAPRTLRVGLCPGALWATKRWPVAYFADLAKRLLQRGYEVVLTGSAAEAPLHRQVQNIAPAALSLAGRGDLAMLGGIIARCHAFVANDSGPMHLARALGVPTVAIFGSTAPAQFDFAGHALLYAHAACAPCSFYGRHRCPRGHLRCLTELGVEQAEHAVLQLLQRGPVPQVAG